MDAQHENVADVPQPSSQDFSHVSVDTILQTFQQATDPSNMVGEMPFPTSAYARSLQEILHVHIPMILEQTRKVIDGVTNAYEPNVDPMWSAGDFDALCNSFDSLKHLLVDTGIGALPLSAPKSSDPVTPQTSYEYPPVDESSMAKQVEETFAKVMSTKEAAAVAFNTLLHGTRQ